MSNSTLKYIGKRLVISLITLFVILMVLFLMVKFLPGSPINNEKLSASARAAIEAHMDWINQFRFNSYVIFKIC